MAATSAVAVDHSALTAPIGQVSPNGDSATPAASRCVYRTGRGGCRRPDYCFMLRGRGQIEPGQAAQRGPSRRVQSTRIC